MSDTSNKARHSVGYAGAVLLRQLNRLLTEAEKLGDAKSSFLEALSEDTHDGSREQAAVDKHAAVTPQQIPTR